MALSDEIKEQQQKLKGQGFKAVAAYIWDYYKVHFIVAVVAILIIISLVRTLVNNSRPEYINVMVLNATYDLSAGGEGLEKQLASYAGVDTKTTRLSFDTTSSYAGTDSPDSGSMAVNLKILAQFQAQTLDVMIAPQEVIEEYAPTGGYGDLREYISEEELHKLEADGFEILTVNVYGKDTPVGINLKSSPYFAGLPYGYPFHDGVNPYFTIALAAPHPDAAVTFLHMLTE